MKTELQEAVMNFELVCFEIIVALDQLYRCLSTFRKHLELAKERNDEILCGLAIGNLGNAYFYLGDYEKSVVYHLKVWFLINTKVIVVTLLETSSATVFNSKNQNDNFIIIEVTLKRHKIVVQPSSNSIYYSFYYMNND